MMKILIPILSTLSLLLSLEGFCQIEKKERPFQLQLETYYGLELKNNSTEQQPYLYNHFHLQKPRINYAQLNWTNQWKDWNIQLGIQDGDYIRRNYSDQPQWAQLISKAQLQFQPHAWKSLKFTMGIFPSHIGFESAWVQNNLTLTRSLLAENSPYYESGAHFQWISKNEKISLGGLILSGWQQAHLELPIKKPSWGWSSNFVLNDNLQLSYNGFWGFQNTAGNIHRQYHNLYSTLTQKNWKAIVGFDLGNALINNHKSQWYSPVAIVSNQMNNHWSIALRYETMIDPDSFILLNNSEKIVNHSSIGLTLRLKTDNQFLFQLEGKQSITKDIDNIKNQNTLIMFSVSKAAAF